MEISQKNLYVDIGTQRVNTDTVIMDSFLGPDWYIFLKINLLYMDTSLIWTIILLFYVPLF